MYDPRAFHLIMSLYAVTAKVSVIPSIQGMVSEYVLVLITQRLKSGVFFASCSTLSSVINL